VAAQAHSMIPEPYRNGATVISLAALCEEPSDPLDEGILGWVTNVVRTVRADRAALRASRATSADRLQRQCATVARSGTADRFGAELRPIALRAIRFRILGQ
jgi:hypothetical protein